MVNKKINVPSNAEELSMIHNAEVLEGISESRESYRKIVRALIGQGVKNLKDGQVVIESVADLERLIKLDLELQRDNMIL